MIRIVAALLLTVVACNTTRIVQPIAKGEKLVGGNFGGAVIKYSNAPIPLPLTSIYGAYGISNTTTSFASLHTTALTFGVLQTDIGFTHQVCAPKLFIPGISISPIVNMMFDTWEQRFSLYPQLDVNAYWNYGKTKKLAYISLNNWFELRSEKAHQEPQTLHWLPSIGLGHQWNNTRYGLQLELKYIAPTQSNEDIVVDYVGLGTQGALGFYISVHRKF